ncbi:MULTISPECIES: acyltransferase [Acidobacteriaceae]|uniref:acyltransferase family protein n=1 Tax=Acidobacteriaceae TaxID=204434 RepID=UPI00131D2B4E|nr:MULTISPECIES: acyltransferase [Acidobacteriaceae]MDW5266387.1 acyltransferase [Edaphobacter sp.]
MNLTNIGRYYRPELDVLRFLAFLSVFIVHRMDHLPINPAQHFWLYNICLLGNFGVPVFFLLSAFLITELLMREDDRLGTIHIGSFYMRRILRIWPLYFGVFYGLVLLSHFIPHIGPKDPLSWLAFTLFAGNWYICSHGWINAFPVNPLWSVSVEEQFYIVIPLIALCGRRFGLKIVSYILIAISYAVVTWYASKGWHGFSSQWTNSFVQFQFFSAGTLLSLFLKGRSPRWSVPVRLLNILIGIACLLIASLYFGVQADIPSSTVLQAPIGWALVLVGTILFFLSLLGTPGRYLPKPIIYLGRISYGLYLFHELVYTLIFHTWNAQLTRLSEFLHLGQWRGGVGTAIAFGAVVLIAHLSYQLYERPFLRLKKRFTFVPSRD